MSALRVHVAIPHFFREGASDLSGGYGSGRSGNRLPRGLALARCLGSVLALNRASQDWILNLAERQLERTPASTVSGLPEIHVELHLFVCGEHWLQEVVQEFLPRLQLHRLELKDPRQLPLEAVRSLLDLSKPAALSMYLEDDLVIQDARYIDKLVWFYEQTEHRFVLMPHRCELSVSNAPQHLYVDGPIKPDDQLTSAFASDETALARVKFWDGQIIEFAKASNPHSGSFCVSSSQLERLRSSPWPPETFVGPLETAATGTVRTVFPVLKPTWQCRDFLKIEHGNPSFLTMLNVYPRRDFQP